VATLRPFSGFRPLPQHAAEVASQPYDVLTSDEARVEAAGKPHSFLHVGKPEIDLPPGTDPHTDEVYRKGKENLDRLVIGGVLSQDPQPSFYLYAQTMNRHVQFGMAGCVSVEEYEKGTIKKHELTRPDKEDDRTRHILATNAHTGPIFLTYHAEPQIDDIVDRIRLAPPPIDFVADDGVRHQLWVIDSGNTVNAIREAFSGIPTLYIADGHHRAAAAARAAKERAGMNPRHTGKEEYNFFLAVAFPHNQVRILEYNRVVQDMNGLNVGALLDALRNGFLVNESEAPVRPDKKGEFGMYLSGKWYKLEANPHHVIDPDPVRRLDVSILQENALASILGINDPRTDKRIDFVGGIRGLEELQRRVDSSEMAIAFSLYPTSVQELLDIADAGKFMPPKSTWFEPKLMDGMVVHFLD